MGTAPSIVTSRIVLDTSIVLEPPRHNVWPDHDFVISTITLAELAAGLSHPDPIVTAHRRERLARLRSTILPLAYSEVAARHYGTLVALTRAAGRNPRPRRFDLLIASVAAEHGIPLLTRNPTDFQDCTRLVEILAVTD